MSESTEDQSINYPPGEYVFNLSIGYSNAQQAETVTIPAHCGFDDQEWLAMSDPDRQDAMDEAWEEWTSNYIDGGFKRLGEDG